MKKILLVDDQPHIIRLMRLSLNRNGYETEVAFNGLEALAKLNESHFDVLVTDVEMPHMNGIVLCETLRKQFPDSKTHIFVITATTEFSIRQWIDSIGDAELIEKPVSLKSLLAKLGEYFKTIEMNHEVAS